MSVEVEVVAGPGAFYGSSANITDYSVNEDATALHPEAAVGGTGQIEFGVIEDPASDGTILLLNTTVELRDDFNGSTEGIVNGLGTRNRETTVTADSRLIKLNVRRLIGAYNGTLGGAFTYYLNQCGIMDRISIDSTIASIPVTLRGFDDEVWLRLNQLAMVHKVEIALVSGFIVFRPIRQREVVFETDMSEGWTVRNSKLAQNVDVYYYNHAYKTNVLAYPYGGWNDSVDVFSVEAGQTVVQEIDVDATLTSLDQPDCVTFVDRNYTGPASVYSVIGNDGLPIPPQQWADGGGALSVAIGADGSKIVVTIRGSNETKYSPYRIAVGAGPSDYYSSLRLVGTGVFSSENVVRLATGVAASKSAEELGAEIRIPEVSTLTQAIDLGMLVAQNYAGSQQQITITSQRTNRAGEIASVVFATFADFDADHAAQTFGAFDTQMSGTTFAALDAIYIERVQSEFANQAFGNVTGARRRFRDAFYRIDSAKIDPETVEYTASRDTVFADFDNIWRSESAVLGYGEGGYGEGGYGGVSPLFFSDVNTQFAGKTFDDMAVIPLWRN